MTEWVKALDFSSQPGFKTQPNFSNFLISNFFILIDDSVIPSNTLNSISSNQSNILA